MNVEGRFVGAVRSLHSYLGSVDSTYLIWARSEPLSKHLSDRQIDHRRPGGDEDGDYDAKVISSFTKSSVSQLNAD